MDGCSKESLPGGVVVAVVKVVGHESEPVKLVALITKGIYSLRLP